MSDPRGGRIADSLALRSFHTDTLHGAYEVARDVGQLARDQPLCPYVFETKVVNVHRERDLQVSEKPWERRGFIEQLDQQEAQLHHHKDGPYRNAAARSQLLGAIFCQPDDVIQCVHRQ